MGAPLAIGDATTETTRIEKSASRPWTNSALAENDDELRRR
jgi:hypothetical protein